MIKMPQEEWDEIMKLREPTPDQLAHLAKMCDQPVYEREGVVYEDQTVVEWNPLNNLVQNHKVLSAVIAVDDCKLFYDDGVNEYFIYKWNNDGPPIAHRTKLNETVIEAAMNLWLPSTE